MMHDRYPPEPPRFPQRGQRRGMRNAVLLIGLTLLAVAIMAGVVWWGIVTTTPPMADSPGRESRAGDAVTRVAGGIRPVVVGAGMDDDGGAVLIE